MELFLIEQFLSVQGESSWAGKPMAFIRLAGCPMRCTWCDTPYSFGKGTRYLIEDTLKQVKDWSCHYVCVTGGEPLLQKNVHILVKALCEEGLRVSIETGGGLPIHEIDSRVKVVLDVKCPGSGMAHKNNWNNLSHIFAKDEVKFVIADREDYQFAKNVIQEYELSKKTEEILFSPVYGLLEPKTLVEWVLEDQIELPLIRINLQTHKYIWPPNTRGV